MKLHLQGPTQQNLVTAYGDGFVAINGERYQTSLIVLPDSLIVDWDATSFDALAAHHFARLATLECEIVLLGTGKRIRFPQPVLSRAVHEVGIGLEVMDTRAACRTYNILMGESRKVAAALLIE